MRKILARKAAFCTFCMDIVVVVYCSGCLRRYFHIQFQGSEVGGGEVLILPVLPQLKS